MMYLCVYPGFTWRTSGWTDGLDGRSPIPAGLKKTTNAHEKTKVNSKSLTRKGNHDNLSIYVKHSSKQWIPILR
jgi:hypothetical protein